MTTGDQGNTELLLGMWAPSVEGWLGMRLPRWAALWVLRQG